MINNFINHITERGFFNQCTNTDLLNLILNKPTIAYIGFDCTADSLHIGSLLPIMLLRAFQKYGHVPIVLLGGGTTLIGDPSGKDETREILTPEKINENKKKLKTIFSKFLSFKDKKNPAKILDNYEWIKNLNYVNFIRDIGSQFSVNRMLTFESVRQRLAREQHLSFLEFNYSIIQSYDFLELYKNHNCMIQFGGSDQWGNIVSGIELIKKKTGKETIGLTTPLLTTSSGQKMGKTNKGAIWLDNDKLNYYDYWQYWRNVDDKDVIKFLKLFTDIDINEIDKFNNLSGSEFNKIKVLLANEATKICHGEEFAKKAEQASMRIFSERKIDKNIPDKNKVTISRNEILKSKSLKEFLVLLNLSKSLGESKRLIESGGVKINNLKILDKNYVIRENDFDNNLINVSVGKKRNGLIEIY